MRVLLWLAFFLTVLLGRSQAQTPTTVFTQPFDWTSKKLSVFPTTNQGLFKYGEPVTIAASNNVTIAVYDIYGRSVYLGLPQPLTFGVGHYFVECNGDRCQFAVLPADYAGISYLGDQAFNRYFAGEERQLRVQPTWFRTGAARWQLVQTASNVWDWSQMDATIANNPGRRIMVIAGGGSPPAWVTPANLVSNYADYLTALVKRYHGNISAVEIWNEPGAENFAGYTNWLSSLAALHVAGSAAIKAIDSSILVLGTSASSAGAVGLSAALNRVASSVDGLSWHDYWSFKFLPDKSVDYDGAVAPDIFGRAQAHRDAAAFNGPLYITELGVYGRSALGIPTPSIEPGYTGGIITNAPEWSVGMARGVKYAVMYRATGTEMMMAHLMTHEDSSVTDEQNALSGWEYLQRGPKPKTSAFLMAGYWLNGAVGNGYRTPGNRMVLSAWQRPNNTSVVFAWAGEGQAFALTNATVIPITDLYGNALQVTQLREQPILFHSSNSNAAGLLQSVMSKLPVLNQPPVPAFLPNYTVFKAHPLNFTLEATDPDQDPVSYSASALPVGATLNAVTGDFAWSPTANQLGQYPITFTVTDARGMSATVSTIISVVGSSDDGLVGWWKLDETAGTLAADSMGASLGQLVDTNNPGAAWVAGRINNAVSLNGINRYINISNAPLQLTNNFTISAWINPRVIPADQGVFYCLHSRYAESGIKLSVNRRKDLFIEGQTATGWKQLYVALGGIQTNAWQHIVLIYDKSNFAVYINGQRQTPAYGVSGWGGDIVMNPIGVTRIGAEGGSAATYLFDGQIDDVRVYGRTLSLPEVASLHQWTGAPPLRAPSNLRPTGR